VGPVLDRAADRPAFDVRVTGVQPLGRGAAYRLESAELAAVHAELRASFADVLTPQDRQPYRPHVTVQNKVDPAVARETVAALRAAFVPGEVRATGLALWRYAGGPWVPVSGHPFRS
jgi:2'-5' RNA ligase